MAALRVRRRATRPVWLAGVFILSCATGSKIGSDGAGDASVQGDAGPQPSTTATTSNTAPNGSPEGSTGGGPGTPPDGSPADTGPPADSGPVLPPCSPGLKRCGAICITPSPTVGCSLNGCTPCDEVEHGQVACGNDTCEVTCDEGYTEDNGACVTPPSCTNSLQDGTESDVDCGGSTCPPCNEGQTCGSDDDCALGPCLMDNTCGCTPKTCADFLSCGNGLDDGCGGTIDCANACPSSEVCFNDSCCSPLTTCPGGGLCDTVDDGCGGTLDCSDACGQGQVCNNGSCCTPRTCPSGACGSSVSDNCGGTLNCSNNCGQGQVCNSGSCCTPSTCPSGACGSVSNGCGGMLSCGGCGSGVCYQGSCCTPLTPSTCPANRCGSISNNCGGTVDCGNPCASGVCSNGNCCTPSSCTMSGCGYQSNGCGGNACTLCGSGAGCDNDNDCQSNNCRTVLIGGCGLLLSRCCE